MTAMTSRCRRHHQNQCEGPTNRGLCAKHRAIWEAMQKDWDTRAKAADNRPLREKRPLWRPWEDNVIRTLTPVAAVAALKTRSLGAVISRRSTLGVGRGVMWTKQEDTIILRYSLQKAAALLPGRTYHAVSERRRRIGLAKPHPAKTGQADPFPSLFRPVIHSG